MIESCTYIHINIYVYIHNTPVVELSIPTELILQFSISLLIEYREYIIDDTLKNEKRKNLIESPARNNHRGTVLRVLQGRSGKR